MDNRKWIKSYTKYSVYSEKNFSLNTYTVNYLFQFHCLLSSSFCSIKVARTFFYGGGGPWAMTGLTRIILALVQTDVFFHTSKLIISCFFLLLQTLSISSTSQSRKLDKEKLPSNRIRTCVPHYRRNHYVIRHDFTARLRRASH